MPITQTTPIADINKYIEQQMKRRERVIINTLAYIGEKCINEARTNGSYTDRTGNLRSSIGYVLAVDGNIKVTSSFEQVLVKGDQKPNTEHNGGAEGKAYAEQLVAQYPQGIVLVVVAGKYYAKYVASKGFNVIASADLQARKLVPMLLGQLQIEFDNANG